MKEHHGTAAKLALLALGIALTQGAAHPAAGQTQAPQQAVEKPLQHEVSVVLKLIHVYVTDKKGNPVPDLTKGDFIVMDNGQPVTVTDLERHVLEPAPVTEAPAARPAPAPAQARPEAVATRASTRKFFLLFDFAFNNARGIVKAKTAALHFLDHELRPGDEVGILSYSMLKGLSVHEYLTQDRDKVREIVAAVGSKDIAGRANDMESWYWRLVEDPLLADPKGGGEDDQGGADRSMAVSNYAYQAKAQREEAKRIAEVYMTRLTDLARSMRFVDGQKHFILFSSGLPNSLVYGMQVGNPSQSTAAGSWGANRLDVGDSVLKSRTEAMVKEFTAAGCMFFSFDTREAAKGTDLFAWDTMGLEAGGRSVLSTQSVFNDSTSLFRDDRTTGQDYLKQMSDLTGGEYFSNLNRYEKNLEQVQELTGTYYVLGYPINERWDGQFHQVKVEVKRKGCEVRAQAGYFNPKPFAEFSRLEKELHLFDLALNERALSRLPDRVPMGAFSAAAEGIARLGLLARVPSEVAAKFAGRRIEFVVIAFDEKGEIADMAREEAAAGAIKGGELAFAAGSTLKPGSFVFRLVIRDMDTGQSAVASTKATVVKPQFTGLQLGTPLLLERRVGCPLLAAGAKKVREAFPWRDIYPYDEAGFAPLLGHLPAGTPAVQAVIPCAIPGGARPELALSAHLIDASTGARSPLTIARLDRAPKGPFEVLTLEIPVAGTAPGSYYLHVYAQDRTSGALGHSFTALTVAGR